MRSSLRHGQPLSVFLVGAVIAFCLTSLRESRAQEAALETGVGDSASAVEGSDLRRLLNQAEGMLWLGLVEKGNPRAFEEALHLVEQARKHLEASELSPPEQALWAECIDAVRDDAAFYIEYSPRRFYGAYPLARVISPVLMAAANDGVTEQLVENPAHFAVRKASQAIDEHMIRFQHPHVTLRSEPADRALESIAIEVLAEAPRPYPHSRRELLDTLTPDELAAYDRGEVSPEIADRLMSAFGAKSLLVVSIVQSIELADANLVLLDGKFFTPDAAEPTDSFAIRGFGRDRRDQLWPMIWTHGVLLLMAMIVDVLLRRDRRWSATRAATAIAIVFAIGRLFMVVAVLLLRHAIPDADSMAATSWWWPAVLGLVAVCGPGLVAWDGQARLTQSIHGSLGTRAVGTAFGVSALGAATYFVGPLLLLDQNQAFASFVPFVLSSVALATLLGFAIRTGPPVPTYFAIFPALATLPLGVALFMASPSALWTMTGVSAAICLLAWVRHRYAVAHGTEEQEPDRQAAQRADEEFIAKLGKVVGKKLPL